MKVSLELIKDLRHMTSASIAECRKALEETSGDLNKAKDVLRKRGLEIAAKKGDRLAKEGRIEAYVHMGNKIGVLLEVVCETDFVARNEEFTRFTKDVAMQVAACSPSYIKKEDVPEKVLAEEKNKEQFIKEQCLMEQAFIKDVSVAIKDLLGNLVGKFSENIYIRRFIRYKIGE